MWLGLIAIVLAALAVLLSGLLWSTRPAVVPAEAQSEWPL